MKKIILFLLIFNIAFANIDYKMYEKYVDDILNYSLELKIPKYNPFYIPQKIEKKENIIKKVIKPKVKLKVLAILNNKVLLNLRINKKNENKWVKVGENIGTYKLIKITKDSILLRHQNKIEILQINKNKFKVRVSK